MDKNSLLYQLMAIRMNSILNDVAEQDEDYQAALSAVDPYIDQLKALQLPKETRHLIDDCVSGYNAIGSCLGRLAYIQRFCDCRELLLSCAQPRKEVPGHGLL